jgi:hypothetical protein
MQHLIQYENVTICRSLSNWEGRHRGIATIDAGFVKTAWAGKFYTPYAAPKNSVSQKNRLNQRN